jgi:hypothetical protein
VKVKPGAKMEDISQTDATHFLFFAFVQIFRLGGKFVHIVKNLLEGGFAKINGVRRWGK